MLTKEDTFPLGQESVPGRGRMNLCVSGLALKTTSSLGALLGYFSCLP